MIVIVLGSFSFILVGYFYTPSGSTEGKYAKVEPGVNAKPSTPQAIYRFPGTLETETADVGSKAVIRLSLSVGFDRGNDRLASEIASRAPQLRDVVLSILRRKKKAELESALEQVKLREQIKGRMNELLRAGRVREVYFREFVVD